MSIMGTNRYYHGPPVSLPDTVTSRANPLVKRLFALKARAEADHALLEGGKLVLDALAAGADVVAAAASPRAQRSASAREAVDALEQAGVPVRKVDDRLLAQLSEAEAPQGVFAIARRPRFEEAQLYRGVPLILVAAGVHDPGNVGALLRTAEAAGATGAYLTTGTADAFSWKALRGAMGSAFRLPQVAGLPAAEVLSRLRARGVARAAAVARGGSLYFAADLGRPMALVVGNEGAGLPAEVEQAVDLRLTIPLHGDAESLNVAVAAGVLLFEAARRRQAG
jgi:TrmH family RNA methyltransferase